MSAKRRKARRRKIAVVSAVALAVLVLVIVLICKGCAGGKKDLSVLQGTWYYDQYTEYEFDGKGNGCMCMLAIIVLAVFARHIFGRVMKWAAVYPTASGLLSRLRHHQLLHRLQRRVSHEIAWHK